MTSASRPGADVGSSELVERIKGWHARLCSNAPPEVNPLLRMQRGAALIQGERARRIDHGMSVLLAVAGRGLEPVLPDIAGVSMRPKVSLEVSADGAGLQVALSYFGRVPGVRAVREAREALGETAYLRVEGGAGHAIRLVLTRAEPPRSLPVVLVEVGGRDFAVPMHFISRAVPVDACGSAQEQASGDATPRRIVSMAGCLGLTAGSSSRGRPARLITTAGDRDPALAVDAVLGHRRAPIYGTGPLLAVIPWLLGVIQVEDGNAVLVVHPRRLMRIKPDLPTVSSTP